MALLRQPRMGKSGDRRRDPFWEVGSFGVTGCHSRNLMNPKRIAELEGCRIAFAQGGPEGFKLVKLTPPVSTERYRKRAEILWQPTNMPFRYASAPLLINNDGETHFTRLGQLLENVKRETWVAAFASRFRSSRRCLPPAVANQIMSIYERMESEAESSVFAETYVDALPYVPAEFDEDRLDVYKSIKTRLRRPRSCKGIKPPRSC